MNLKRVLLLAGHYGSGKTNIAVNMAMELKRKGNETLIADIDIVNPYFRTKDSQKELEAAGIPLICSAYANSNVDIPALPQELYLITEKRDSFAVVDIGGDDRGALALGRLSDAIKDEDNYEMFLVVNVYRPLTRNLEDMLEVVGEIEAASKLPFTAIINNSNLGEETTAEQVLASVPLVEEIASALQLPVKMTTVKETLADELSGKIENLFALTLQDKII
ncbi:MAG: hypothetical protein IJD83_06960 [Clostridia bacterium]|nr:hypothetical protein [Clostridia bacterium]